MKRVLSILMAVSLIASSTFAVAADVAVNATPVVAAQSLSADEVSMLAKAQAASPQAVAVTAGEVDPNVAVLGMVIVAIGALLYVSYN